LLSRWGTLQSVPGLHGNSNQSERALGEPVPPTLPPTRYPGTVWIRGRKSPPTHQRDVTTAQRWEKREECPSTGTCTIRWARSSPPRRVGHLERTRNQPLSHPAIRERGTLSHCSFPTRPHPSISESRTRWKIALPLLAVVFALVIGVALLLSERKYFWRSPIADARFPNRNGLRRRGTAATMLPRWPFRGLPCRTATGIWTSGHSGRFWRVPQLTQGKVTDLVNPLIPYMGFHPMVPW